MFLSRALKAAEASIHDPEEFNYIMQGHRNRRSKDLYIKMRKSLVDNKEKLFTGQKGEAWAANLVNVLYSFACDRPTSFGQHRYNE